MALRHTHAWAGTVSSGTEHSGVDAGGGPDDEAHMRPVDAVPQMHSPHARARAHQRFQVCRSKACSPDASGCHFLSISHVAPYILGCTSTGIPAATAAFVFTCSPEKLPVLASASGSIHPYLCASSYSMSSTHGPICFLGTSKADRCSMSSTHLLGYAAVGDPAGGVGSEGSLSPFAGGYCSFFADL